MDNKELDKKRKELEAKYSRMMDAHTKKGHIASEGAHYDSAMAIKAIYEELSVVAEKLGDPVPVWM
jgi:hypothetical protein